MMSQSHEGTRHAGAKGRMKAPLLLIAAMVCFSSIACDIDSTEPLAEEDQVVLDLRLIGAWKDEDDSVFVVRQHPTKKLLVLDDGPGEQLAIYPTAINGLEFFTVSGLTHAAESDKWEHYRYKIVDQNTVCVYLADEDEFKRAITQGDLQGNPGGEDKTEPDVTEFSLEGADLDDLQEPTITAATAEMRDYFGQHGADLFPDVDGNVVTLTRVAP